MIRGVHTMFYTSKPKELRNFLKAKLGLKGTDVGEGWVIFDVPEAEMGCHPAEEHDKHSKSGTPSISFYCDDIEKTVAGLKKKGVKFEGAVQDHGYGLVAFMKVPGGFSIQLYQPRYKVKRSGKK